jgi:magnesium-transporting ATPase (P-type)
MVTLHEIKDPQAQDISPFNGKNDKESYVIAVKGAPDVVLGLCNRIQKKDNTNAPLDEKGKQTVLAANDAMTQGRPARAGYGLRIVSTSRSRWTVTTLKKTWSLPAWWA